MRACEGCQRVRISRRYSRHRNIRSLAGLPFIYLPILLLPFLALAAFSVWLHLRLIGAENLKSPRDFWPERSSHRYTLKSQILYRGGSPAAFWARTRIFWIFNCTWYCPLSIGFLEWFAYLVKVVENWWCPFGHSRVAEYADACIDKSYWHTPANLDQLHPEDRDNPIFHDPGA